MKIKHTASQISRVPWFIFISLPLVYIPDDLRATVVIRSMLFVLAACLVFVIPAARNTLRRSLSNMHKVFLVGIILCIVLMGLSTIATNTDPIRSLLGAEPSYMGLLQWYSVIVLAVTYWRDVPKLILHRYTMRIFALICIVSLIIDAAYVFQGNRLEGLLLQATMMSCVGVVTCVLGLFHSVAAKGRSVYVSLAAILAGFLVVATAQSKVGVAGLLLVFAFFVFRIRSSRVAVITGILFTVLLIVAAMQPAVFMRFADENVSASFSYRGDMYALSGREIADKRLALGLGPTNLPQYINDSSLASDDLARSLNVGLRFASSHDFYLDLALKFGALVALFFVAMQLLWLSRPVLFSDFSNQVYLLITALFFVYALVDVTTLTVSPYLVMLSAGLYSLKIKSTHEIT